MRVDAAYINLSSLFAAMLFRANPGWCWSSLDSWDKFAGRSAIFNISFLSGG